MTETLQLFFALLAILTNVTAVAIIGTRLAYRSNPEASPLVSLEPIALWLAWLVATTATLGSLYFSEVANFTPCTLCWYQRIAMYPLSVILLVAAIRRDRTVAFYAVPIAAIGAVIATYHYLIERFPDLEGGGVCSAAVPCTFVWFEELGFVTLPYMALSAFLLILALLTLPRTQEAVA